LLQIGILSAATNVGTIVMWRFLTGDTGGGDVQAGRSGFPTSTDPAQNWLRELPCNVRGAVKQLTWSQSHPLLAVNTITAVFVLREQELCAHYDELVSVTFSSIVSGKGGAEERADVVTGNTECSHKRGNSQCLLFCMLPHCVLYNEQVFTINSAQFRM
jgi:hypothetical protein